jgi:hypothetical protein
MMMYSKTMMRQVRVALQKPSTALVSAKKSLELNPFRIHVTQSLNMLSISFYPNGTPSDLFQ